MSASARFCDRFTKAASISRELLAFFPKGGSPKTGHRSRHDEPPWFATLNLTRPHRAIAQESRFQGLGIRTAKTTLPTKLAASAANLMAPPHRCLFRGCCCDLWEGCAPAVDRGHGAGMVSSLDDSSVSAGARQGWRLGEEG